MTLAACRRAYFTVETALLTPVILLVIFAVIYSDLHILNRTLCRSAAVEQAVSGKVDDALPLMLAEAPVRRQTETSAARRVAFESATRITISSSLTLPIASSADYRKVQPTGVIRHLRSLRSKGGDAS